jgi:hypothetical protein
VNEHSEKAEWDLATWRDWASRHTGLRGVSDCELQQALDSLLENSEEFGEPDPSEHRRVTMALEECGSIARAALYLGVSDRRMKRLIVQHRVEWPRTSTLLKEKP